MRHQIRNIGQHFGIVYLLFWLASFWGLFIPTPAICDNSVADKIVSLNVTNRPLGEVLEDLSIAAGKTRWKRRTGNSGIIKYRNNYFRFLLLYYFGHLLSLDPFLSN